MKNVDYECFTIFENHYIFDSNSQTAIAVNNETFKLLQLMKKKSIPENSNSKSLAFINALKKNNILTEYKTSIAPNFVYSSHMLSLVHTQRCNLRCAYCFSHEKISEFDMNIETAKKAIHKFLETFGNQGKQIVIDLTGAGEPLINKDFFIKIVEYITRLRKQGHNITPSIITNGMLLNDYWCTFFKENSVFWAISIDGNKEKHEQSRSGANYNKIISNYLNTKNKTGWLYYGIRATYNSENCDITEIFESLYKIGYGYQISINPVRLSKGGFGEFNNSNINYLIKSYNLFCEHLLNFTLNLDIGRIHSYFSGESYFRKFIGTLLNHTKTIFRCSAGVQNFAVNNKGDIFICTSTVGYNQSILGNLDEGVLQEKQDFIKSLYADNLSKCKECWARYNCAGPCMAESLYYNGKLGSIIPVKCKLTKHLIKLAIYYCHQVYIKRPDILRFIQERYCK